MSDAVDGDLRPVSRRELNGYAIGALQVFIDGTFGTVCGAFFSNVQADVACRQLGFAGGGISPFADETLTQAELLEAAAPTVLEHPSCTGSEARLIDCPAAVLDQYSYFGDYTLDARSCASQSGKVSTFIACASASGPGQEGGLRLVDRTKAEGSTSGVLELFHAGAWGTFCEEGRFTTETQFPERAAIATCRQLGLPATGAMFEALAPDAAAARPPPWLNVPACAGSEGRLTACGALSYGDVGVCDFYSRLVCATGP